MSNTESRIRRTLLVVLPILGIAIGIALIVSGTQIEEIAAEAKFYYTTDAYGGRGNLTRLGELTFGTDYYTDMYEATAFTGNVLKAIFDLAAFALPAAFKLGGSLVILSSARRLLESFKLEGLLAVLSSLNKPAAAPVASEPKETDTSLDQAATQSRSTDTDEPTTASEDTQPPQGNESESRNSRNQESACETAKVEEQESMAQQGGSARL